MDRVTKPQKKMLITLLRETKFIEGKKEKEWYWEKIQAALNTIGPKKTIIQWKKCWRDMRLTTRKKLAELKRCQLAGGSPPPGIELNQEDSEIIDIVGSEYFYEEMNGELKPESFISNFDYVPEHFCDTILTAAAVSSGQQHLQQQKEQQLAAQHQQDRHTNDGENNDAGGSSNQNDSHGGSFQTTGVSQLQSHNGEHVSSAGTSQQHNAIPQNSSFHGGLQSHFLRRQQYAAAALQRETAFEEKLLLLMQAAFPKKIKKRKNRDPDKLFLLSLYEDIKRIPEEIRLDVKCELIQVIKNYQKKLPNMDRNHSHTLSSSKQTSATATDKIQLSHSMYQLQKKYEKNEKEPSPQSQVERVQHVRDTGSVAPAISLHASQQIQHSLYQLQKKFEENNDKVHQQNDQQRKHGDASHQQQNVGHQPPPPSNDQHMHHPQMTHGILFPLPHPHNLHPQQPQHPHQQQNQHHPPTIFGSTANPSSISTDRPPMTYENVG